MNYHLHCTDCDADHLRGRYVTASAVLFEVVANKDRIAAAMRLLQGLDLEVSSNGWEVEVGAFVTAHQTHRLVVQNEHGDVLVAGGA